MNVFVSEYLCSGACDLSQEDASLLTEGTAMLDAVVTDLLAIPDCTVTVCVQESLPLVSDVFQQAEHSQRLQIVRVTKPEQEQADFDRACQNADVVWVIAPEFDSLLVSRTERALQSDARVVGPDLDAIQLTADKWRLFEFLSERELPTIPTVLMQDELTASEAAFPCLIKHRFGAGGQGLEFLTKAEDWLKRRPAFGEQRSDYIMQPFLAGRSFSTVVLADIARREIFPPGEQRINWEPNFAYQGGAIPVKLEPDVVDSIHKLISRVCEQLPGLVGYVGFDILLPDADPKKPLIVEINPRLTTSYVGYRQLTLDNLAERIVHGNAGFPSLKWELERDIQFLPDGSVFLNQSRSLKEKKH
ncbi:ATP-grasp domain-containing protein [Gimesia fumaroli]|uniref:Carbamoyl phosphate synthase-like protein n=1 Tax=Gimesia fumaroli TaxID=2527976 RepID=A0A518IHI4_9PLAN|nr:ATP-grasp domain-containing protein [Gimesia fumaroli]QDV52548.1 carbamoyl phosphate synthase-like protein [Gimesia fumaroli]